MQGICALREGMRAGEMAQQVKPFLKTPVKESKQTKKEMNNGS